VQQGVTGSNTGRSIALILVALLGIATLAPKAWADDPPPRPDHPAACSYRWGTCQASAQTPPTPEKVKTGSRQHQPTATKRSGLSARELKLARDIAEIEWNVKVFNYHRCLTVQEMGNRNAPATCPKPTRPKAGAARAAAPAITPAQAAASAVARLQLPVNTPGIGPDPDKNRWKMAAVGFPYWLWAEGPAHIGPVRQNVANLSVSLEARISKTVFEMGDGKTVTCAGPGTRYPSWVEAGTKSPSCGYTYTKPSLPRGDYTVSAVSYWAVTWHVNGATGVITVPRRGTAQLPVGELQVLVR
jgi:hypothetical protein